MDILKGALRQDERKHKAMLKEDSQEVRLLRASRRVSCGEVDFAAAHVQGERQI